MSFTQGFPLKDKEPPSVALTALQLAADATRRSGPKPSGEPSLSPSEAARDEHENTVAHTMPDDPEGDFA
ncbi:hypothetical protein QCE73_38830 [Caballeronia sp. LZ029]|jgi:hypothetical protein|uniref:Uncharacterized protein n=1 Tax=Caballeronia glebae TaxID=1777143 RepID=A0A158CA54_9BURK|nr:MULTISPECIES: hypothetical protein [Caballeronia]MDR5749098.1 hypothetical protein [Caballeronia sp. LZ029]SAK79253.1 hypothetical protein AWB82_05170 [Caballeronia glebae]